MNRSEKNLRMNQNWVERELKKKVASDLGIDVDDLTAEEERVVEICSRVLTARLDEMQDLEKKIYFLEIDLKNKKIEVEEMSAELRDFKNRD